MKPSFEDLIKNTDYKDAFHMYFQYVGRNKRYANIYKRKMDKIEKSMTL